MKNQPHTIEELENGEEITSLISSIGKSSFTKSFMTYLDELEKRKSLLIDVQRFCAKRNPMTKEQLHKYQLHRLITNLHSQNLVIPVTLQQTKSEGPQNLASRPISSNKSIKDKLMSSWKKYTLYNTAKSIYLDFNMPIKEPSLPCPVSTTLLINQSSSRGAYLKQRIHNELVTRQREGWFMSFDTLTIDDNKLNELNDNPLAVSQYTQEFRRLVNETEKKHFKFTGENLDNRYGSDENYSYLAVFEFGDKSTERLHFHLIHLMRTLPTCAHRDINFGVPHLERTNTEFKELGQHWPYGISQNLPIRYSGDAYTQRLRWLRNIDPKTGKLKEIKPLIAVERYISKYVTKASELASERIKLKQANWDKHVLGRTSFVSPSHFRIRTSRGFGMQCPILDDVSLPVLAQLCKLSYEVCRTSSVVGRLAKRELATRCMNLTPRQLKKHQGTAFDMLSFLRKIEYGTIPTVAELDGYLELTDRLTADMLMPQTIEWMKKHEIYYTPKIQPTQCLGSK